MWRESWAWLGAVVAAGVAVAAAVTRAQPPPEAKEPRGRTISLRILPRAGVLAFYRSLRVRVTLAAAPLLRASRATRRLLPSSSLEYKHVALEFTHRLALLAAEKARELLQEQGISARMLTRSLRFYTQDQEVESARAAACDLLTDSVSPATLSAPELREALLTYTENLDLSDLSEFEDCSLALARAEDVVYRKFGWEKEEIWKATEGVMEAVKDLIEAYETRSKRIGTLLTTMYNSLIESSD